MKINILPISTPLFPFQVQNLEHYSAFLSEQSRENSNGPTQQTKTKTQTKHSSNRMRLAVKQARQLQLNSQIKHSDKNDRKSSSQQQA
jgi:hypothetical protein